MSGFGGRYSHDNEGCSSRQHHRIIPRQQTPTTDSRHLILARFCGKTFRCVFQFCEPKQLGGEIYEPSAKSTVKISVLVGPKLYLDGETSNIVYVHLFSLYFHGFISPQGLGNQKDT